MRITLVIPARDEAGTIARTLDEVMHQSRRPDELVLVDAGSTDDTRAVVERHAIGRTIPTRVVTAGPAYPGRARNLGVRAASGDWLAFTDAGVRLSPAWLEGLAGGAASAPDAGAIAGDWNVDPANAFAESLALAIVPAPDRSSGTPMRPPNVISLLIRRDAWHRAGPFREDLRSAEDVLFLARLHQVCRVVRAPGRHARWAPPDTPRAAGRRLRSYARHNLRAGLFNAWQGPLLLRYAAVAAGTVAVAAWTPVNGWLAALWLWGLMLAARSATAAVRNRGVVPGGVSRQLLRLVLLIPITALADAAAIAGTLDWLAHDAFAGPPAAREAPDTPADRPGPH